MKIVAILLCFIFCKSVYSQANFDEATMHTVDSLIQLIGETKDQDQQVDLVILLYTTRVETNPLQIMDAAKHLSLVAQKTKNKIPEAASWAFYGQAYRLTGNYVKGLECHHKAVALAEETGNKTLLAMCLNQMGHIYKDREENEKALKIYRSSREYALQGKNEELPLWPMMNMGAIFLALNQPDSSLYYSNLAYKMGEDYEVIRALPYTLTNIAGAYSKKGDNAKAMEYFSKAIKEAESSNSDRYKNLAYVGLAEHFQRKHQTDSSAFYAKQALVASQNTLSANLSLKPAKLLTDLYENSNADSTLKYLKIYRAANDTLFSTRANQQLQMMTFEEDQRQQELAAEKIKFQNKLKTNILLGVLFTIGLVAFILYRNNKQKHKANLQLRQQKEEIESTLSQLRQTQTQLIQSEKMASLGEMTAGIAHEIQNPLNFVNNFSEVNSELIVELKEELTKGNVQSANELAENIKENEEKIVFHGKRADSIVKSMLLHSRTGTSQKELTDINAMVDEYVRLAYHGMRAKDKSFNVDFKTDLDPNLPKINVVQQDIGRVILNLINNAFQALASAPNPSTPQPPIGGVHKAPTVLVSTNKKPPIGGWGVEGLGAGIVISISDNGPGIPDSIKDKIFQPFFTTKPAGQGTGLGLSLSYDIVKAHGGELKVESKEGEGTTFIIYLPNH